MRFRNGFAVVGCLLLLAACQKAGNAPAVETASAAPDGACNLKVGWDPWEPYQYEDADGSVRGMDVDIVRDLAKGAGCGVTFTRGNWKDLLGGVKAGTVDILMAATPTDDRQAYAAFSPSYRRETFVVLTRVADASSLGAMDLPALVKAGKRIGLTDGYYYGDAVTSIVQADTTRSAFVLAPVVELNYNRLVAGEIDALIDDPNVAAAVLRRKGLTEKVVRNTTDINSGDVSFMFSRKSVPEATVWKFNSALVARRGDGTLDRLMARYQGGLQTAPAMGGGAGVSAKMP